MITIKTGTAMAVPASRLGENEPGRPGSTNPGAIRLSSWINQFPRDESPA